MWLLVVIIGACVAIILLHILFTQFISRHTVTSVEEFDETEVNLSAESNPDRQDAEGPQSCLVPLTFVQFALADTNLKQTYGSNTSTHQHPQRHVQHHISECIAFSFGSLYCGSRPAIWLAGDVFDNMWTDLHVQQRPHECTSILHWFFEKKVNEYKKEIEAQIQFCSLWLFLRSLDSGHGH